MKNNFLSVYPALLTVLAENNYTIFPDETGVPHLIKIDNSPLTELELAILGINVESVSFNLYTRLELFFGNLFIYWKYILYVYVYSCIFKFSTSA